VILAWLIYKTYPILSFKSCFVEYFFYFSDNYNECEAAEITSDDEPEPPEKTDRCSKRQPKKNTYEDFVSGKD